MNNVIIPTLLRLARLALQALARATSTSPLAGSTRNQPAEAVTVGS